MSAKGILYNIQRMSVHDGPGIRTTMFFKGCPLSCQWCSNPESQGYRPELLVFEDLCAGCGACDNVCAHGAVVQDGEKRNRDLEVCINCGGCAATCPTGARAMSGQEHHVSEVMAIVRKDAGFYRNSGGGVTFGGGECTSQPDFLVALLEASRGEGYHTCVDTCGCCSSETFEKVMPLADLFLYDLKHMDAETHKRLAGADNRLILKNLRRLLQRAPQKARIRMPLIPGVNDGEENIKAMSDFLKPLGCAEVEVMPHHFFGRSKYLATKRQVAAFGEYSPEELKETLQRFSRHGLTTTVV